MANWDQLLPELLIVIVRKVDLYEDVVAFGGVCKSWRSVAVKENLRHPSYPNQPPWLMLAEKAPEADFRGFVSLSKGGMVHYMELPEARGKRCICSMGWLITIDEGGAMELLHPLARTRISLPHLRTCMFFEEEIEENSGEPMLLVSRATISASPSATDDYAVMLIVGYRSVLVFWIPGDKAWTHVEGGPYLDVIYHKNKFYAVDAMANIVACDLQGLNPTTLEIVGSLWQGLDVAVAQRRQVYFVECGGCLLLAKKLLRWNAENEFRTGAFKVVKAGDSKGLSEWQEVNDLGGRSIFVGHNTAICVDSPAAVGVKADCIYFTDDYTDRYGIDDDEARGNDMGIYNMESRKVEPLCRGTSVSEYCPPIWVSPSF